MRCFASGILTHHPTMPRLSPLLLFSTPIQMHRAVYARDKPGLQLFMQARPQGLKQADHHGNTPLLLALKLGRTEMAWVMVRAGAELDVPSDGSFHLLVSFRFAEGCCPASQGGSAG